MAAPGTVEPGTKCGVAMHDGNTCKREPCDNDGRCICHSQDPNKDVTAFQTEVNAMLARKDYDFTRFVFPTEFHFQRCIFDGPVCLDHAKFYDIVSFEDARFRGPASFPQAQFSQNATFDGATFEGATTFHNASFGGQASFSYATFERDALFRGSKDKRHDNQVFSPQEVTDFRDARFLQPEKVMFKHVYLGKARFLECDVRQVEFTDVEWPARGKYSAVWDEMERGGPAKNYPRIGKLYRQLKHNYEEQRDPITAGDFHFGEMEMRRLEKPPQNAFARFLKRYLSPIAFYRWISGYGEDYVQALACILGVILAFAVVFAYIPVFALEPGSSSTASESMRGLGSRLIYSAMCFLLRGDRPLQPLYPPGYYWSVAEGVIGPPLIALFILALNRRFKR